MFSGEIGSLQPRTSYTQLTGRLEARQVGQSTRAQFLSAMLQPRQIRIILI